MSQILKTRGTIEEKEVYYRKRELHYKWQRDKRELTYLGSKFSKADTIDVKTLHLDLQTYLVYINSVDKPHHHGIVK